VDLTVVGPEAPLIAGIVDAFEAKGLRIFGPSREPAMIEGSKAYAKGIMLRAGIPTANCAIFDDPAMARDYLRVQPYPLVIKADGAAAGKGVVIAGDFAEAERTIHAMMERRVFGEAGDKVLVEECLSGEEASIMAFCDGDTVIPMIAIQDHKRAFDNDQGPNTGGMGAYAPVPAVSRAVFNLVAETILRPAAEAIRDTGIPYRGVLYAGVMLTSDGPRCLEFNCRFGDPEAQVALPLLETDLADILCAAVDVELEKLTVKFAHRSAICVVMASGGYPGPFEAGKPVHGLEAAAKMDAVAVFHAGTAEQDGQIVTDGGRVLGITATGETLPEARERCYAAAGRIAFEGAHYRTDIGNRALAALSAGEDRHSETA
jgi:phosphoribosylamine--glycine ligase